MIERIHQTIGNIIRTFEFNEIEVNEEDPWAGILGATMYAVRATYHTTLKATPMQLVFGHDAILNTKFEANWMLIKQNKEQIINKNNVEENAKRIRHIYHRGDKVLLKNKQPRKFGLSPYIGPYKILVVQENGTVVLRKGIVLETVNIRNVKPYRS